MNSIKAVDRVIYYSKLLIKYKNLLLKLRLTKASACTLKIFLPSHSSFDILIKEVERRITECNDGGLKMWMRALLQKSGHDFGFRKDYHLSGQELKDGYVLLTDKNTELVDPFEKATHILLLKDYNKLDKGTILPYDENCKSILIHLKGIVVDINEKL